ncbi:MAG: DUF4174 domain-containing protein [Paracoccaceae bacterium]|jgi:hypothetical protein
MKTALIITALLSVLATGARASDAPEGAMPIYNATDIQIEDFIWIKRPVVVFADSENDPRFRDQLDLLTKDAASLEARDVVVIVDTAPADRSALRQKLRPRGFSFVLMGKDGTVKQRKASPWSARDISRSIDKMPMRREEIRRAKDLGSLLQE